MDNQVKPEKLYLGFLRLSVLIGAILAFVAAIIIILYFNANFDAHISIFSALIILALILAGEYFHYWFTTRVYLGKTMASGSQRHLKQVVYIIGPMVLIGAIAEYSRMISKYGVLGYALVLIGILVVWGLFFWRLKNKEKTEGKDTQPILTLGEIIILILAIIIIAGLFYYVYITE